MDRGRGRTPRRAEGDTGGIGRRLPGLENLREGELTESDRKTSTVLSGLEELVVYQDLDNRIVWTNKAAGDSVDTDASDLIGRRCFEVWHGRDAPCDGCPVVKARETGEPQHAEITSPDGRHWSIRGFPILDDAGAVAGVVEITSETTSMKKSEEAFRRLAEHSLQGLGIFRDRKLVLANPPLAQMLGRSLDDLYAMSYRDMLDVIHPDDREKLRSHLRDRFDGKPVQEKQTYRVFRPDGEVRTLETLSKITEYMDAPALQVSYWDVTDSLRIQEAYTKLVESSLQGLAILQDGRVVFANEVIADVVGVPREAIYGFSNEQVRALVPDEFRDRTAKSLIAHLEGREAPTAQETSVVRADGSVRRLNIRVQAIEYMGKPALQVVFNDVTDKRGAEEAYRTLVETSLQGISIIQDGRTVYSNPAALEVGGRTAREIYDASPDEILQMVHEDDRETVVRGMEALLADEPVEVRQTYRIVRPGGEVRLVDTIASIIDYHGRPAIQVAMSDVTEARLAQERLTAERDRAQMYLDVAGVIILVLDASGRVTLINRQGCEILGGEEEDILGRSWVDTFIPERCREEIAQVFDQVVTGEIEPGAYYENPVLTLDGEERIIGWSNTMIRDESGAIIATLSSGEDVTEKRGAEEERLRLHAQLQQSQKLEAIGTLAGGVAHEINNPVNITMNFARLIKDRCEEGSEIQEFAQEIIDEGERMSSIVKKLLSFARQEKERHSSARVVDIVGSTVSLMKMVMRKDQIELEVDVPEDLPEILCRSQQIQQVLMNLFTNARDALNDRYPGAHPAKVIRVTACLLERDGEPWVRTTVEDRGIGIMPGALEKVFDPFFTTKSREQGTGLGLSVSYGIVKEHRGDLWVESEPGSYTRFHVDLRVDNGWRLDGAEAGD